MLRRMQGESGGTLVELALILPTFLLILLASAEFAILGYDSIEVTNAAYAGAVYGSQSTTTASDTTNIQLAAKADAVNVAGVTATSSVSCACSNGTTISCSTAAALCVSPNRIWQYLQVTTTATVDPLFYVPALPKTYTLHGQAVVRVQM